MRKKIPTLPSNNNAVKCEKIGPTPFGRRLLRQKGETTQNVAVGTPIDPGPYGEAATATLQVFLNKIRAQNNRVTPLIRYIRLLPVRISALASTSSMSCKKLENNSYTASLTPDVALFLQQTASRTAVDSLTYWNIKSLANVFPYVPHRNTY